MGGVGILVVVVNHHYFKKSDRDGKDELAGTLSVPEGTLCL